MFVFQRYYWFKKKQAIWSADRPFPMDVEYMLRDTMESLRPKQKVYESFEEAQKAVDELEQEYRAKLGMKLAVISGL